MYMNVVLLKEPIKTLLIRQPYREDVTSHIPHQPLLFMPPRTTAKHFPITDSRPSLIKWCWQIQSHYLQLLIQRSCWTQTAMALIGNLTGLWLVVLLIIQSANVGGRSFCIHCVDVLLKLMWWWLLCFSFNTETLLKILDVPFPPAPPTSENLDDICCQAHGRMRYLESFFPRSGRSYLRRRGKAINRLESWYAFCCSDKLAEQSDILVLCCAQQAVSVCLCCCVLETEATITKIVTGKY